MSRLADLNMDIGETRIANWKAVSQQRIDRFADATDDFQFIHVDPQRASIEAPFGGSIAHGFLTLSLLSAFASDVIVVSESLKSFVIVALDRVKFVAPLRAGKRVRGIFTLERANHLSVDKLLLKVQVAIEIEGESRPALTCDVSWVALFNDASAPAAEGEVALA